MDAWLFVTPIVVAAGIAVAPALRDLRRNRKLAGLVTAPEVSVEPTSPTNDQAERDRLAHLVDRVAAAAQADSFQVTDAQIGDLTARVSKKPQNRWQRFNSGARYIVVGSTPHLDAPLAEAFLRASYSSLVPQRASRSQMPYLLFVVIAMTVDASAIEWARSVPRSHEFQVVLDASTTTAFFCNRRLWDASQREPRRYVERYVLRPLAARPG